MSDAATVLAQGAGAWTPRGAWCGILQDGHFGAKGAAGVTVMARDGLGIASLIVGDGGADALAEVLTTRLGLTLPTNPQVSVTATHALLWAGPGQWLLVDESRHGFAETLQGLSGLAAVADQSDGRAVLRLSGANIRAALAKGCMIDLHALAFPVGSTALTSIAHLGVHLWRAADGPEGAIFEIMVARSMAGSFWSWFSASAAEFGCRVMTKSPTTGRG